MDKYFGDTANVNFGRLTASARPLFRAPRPGNEKTLLSIEFNYHPTQRASYRIKRVLIHILSGHVLELIATGIFYGFLNIFLNTAPEGQSNSSLRLTKGHETFHLTNV